MKGTTRSYLSLLSLKANPKSYPSLKKFKRPRFLSNCIPKMLPCLNYLSCSLVSLVVPWSSESSQAWCLTTSVSKYSFHFWLLNLSPLFILKHQISVCLEMSSSTLKCSVTRPKIIYGWVIAIEILNCKYWFALSKYCLKITRPIFLSFIFGYLIVSEVVSKVKSLECIILATDNLALSDLTSGTVLILLNWLDWLVVYRML